MGGCVRGFSWRFALRRQTVSPLPECTTRLERAVWGLAATRPEFSARTVFTDAQYAILAAVFTAAIAFFALWPGWVLAGVVCCMSAGFVVSMLARSFLVLAGRHQIRETASAPIGEWPVYSVLIPLYHEAGILPDIVKALSRIDYPADKLDIHLVLEEGDCSTITAARQYAISTVIVPEALPRTKPKAVNFAAELARGEFLVIYDAEDRPEPDQLKKAVIAFHRHPEICCFQARLVVDRTRHWIQHMFALDYGLWFSALLSGLERLSVPFPLGGTSNHFRRSDLFGAGLWDPFNVTEDADLGLRLARLGKKVGLLDSATFEEAPAQLGVWLRQRTRWTKGYMQTLLVHLRSPVRLVREIGLKGLIATVMFLGGGVWSGLVNPLLWLSFMASSLNASWEPDMMRDVAQATGSMLLVVNGLIAALGSAGRKPHPPFSAILSYPVYWLLISVAAYRALWQLLRDPFSWEKTPHRPSSGEVAT
jgi:Glycosyltransferases, probably involved in cell wall biogenesis